MTFWLFVIASLLGLGALLFTQTLDEESDSYARKVFRGMGWTGYIVGVLACMLLASVSSGIGVRWAKDNQLTYNEFWNGYETEANHFVQGCERDGACRHEYDCDPYEVAVHHSASYDSKGNMTSPAYTTYETHYHSCPYATEEHTFSISTSLKKDFTIAAGWFSENPRQWRGNVGLPDVPRGDPPFWKAAKQRIESGDPGPVVITNTYKNYILASQNSILKQFSDAVDEFKAKNLLPPMVMAAQGNGIIEPYLGTKVYFPKRLSNEDAWRIAVNKFDAALGTNLQGDMHVVFVDKDIDKDRYKGALNAYWTGPEMEKNGLSKNGIVLIIGTDGQTGSWVRAFTGMPGGNEGMIVELENLKNFSLSDPGAFLGQPRGVINAEKKVKEITHTEGTIEKIVWGPNKFTRVCMVCADADDRGTGFSYLDGQIEPTGGQVATIVLITSFLYLFVWAGIAWAQIPNLPLGPANKKGA